MCRKLDRSNRGDFDFMHPPAERQFQCQPLIYSTVIVRMHRSQADISQNSTNHVIDQPSGGWWMAEADALTGGTSNGGKNFALLRSNQTLEPPPLPPFPTPSFWSESFWQWCISLCSTGLAGLAGNATDPPRVEEWGIKQRETSP